MTGLTMNTIRQKVFKIMYDGWQDENGNKHPLVFENSKANFDEETVEFYCYFRVLHADVSPESFLGDRDTTYFRFATAIASIYVKNAIGNKQADDLAEQVIGIFENQTTDLDIIVTSVVPNEFGQTDRGLRYDVSIFFQYQV